jgi:hypothetical protein
MDSEDKSEETAKGEGQPTVESVVAIAKEKLPGIVAAAIRQASESKRGKLTRAHTLRTVGHFGVF